MAVVKLFLSKAQMTKLRKGQGIQLSRSQLLGNPQSKMIPVDVDVSDAMHKRIASAARRQKGVRISANSVALPTGDGFNFKDFGNLLADGAQQIKKVVPKSAVKGIAKAGLSALGVDNAVADSLVDNSVNAAYSTNFKDKKAGQKFLRRTAEGTAQDALQYGVNKLASMPTGNGLKGSQEMKDKMARLRAMRGGKRTTGGSIMGGNVKSMVDAIETKAPASKPSTSRKMIQHGVLGVDAVSGKSLEKRYYATAPTGNGFVPIGSGFRPLGSN
jgi:hypothetical protein